MQSKSSLAVLIGVVALASGPSVGASRAHGVPTPVERSAPHEALSFFEGTWTTADAKPEDNFREVCTWLAEGRRHMVCRSKWMATAGPREGLSIFSFESSTGEYLYHGFRAGGAVVTQRGRRTQNGWVFGSDRGLGADRVRTRVTIESSLERGFTFLSETAQGDGPWSEAGRAVYQRLGQ